MCDNYVHLHNHSEFSLKDGFGRIDDLTDYVGELKQRAMALTDHGTLAGMVQFYIHCKRNNIIPIFGNEMYFRYLSDKINHITILARNEIGLNNLIKLNNDSYLADNLIKRKSGDTPTITLEHLNKYADGLIILTGCVASAIHLNDYDFGLQYTKDLIRQVGKDNVFGELMFTMAQQDHFTRVLNISNDLGINYVITNDCHFAKKEYGNLHPLAVQMRSGYSYESETLYVMTEQEIKDLSLQYVSEDVWNNSLITINNIVDSIEKISLESDPVLPHISQNELDVFIKTLEVKLQQDLENNIDKQTRIDRFNLELKVVKDKGFTDYFYILNDIYQYAQQENILVSLRGSGAGSYLLYLMGVSWVDPIQNGLLFERFLNYARKDYPDADLDCSTNGRDKILRYANERWGMFSVATYSRYQHNMLIADLFRMFHLIPKELEEPIKDFGIESQEYKTACNLEPRFGKLYDVMIGQIRHRGKHAGAVASISVKNVPMENGLIALAEGNDKELSLTGVVKYDLLAIKELDKQENLYKYTGVKPPKNVNDFNPEIFRLLQENKTFNIFQVDASSGIQQLTKSINPDSFDSISAAIALYRPGALDAGTAQLYTEYKRNPRKLHPKIDQYLEDTFGVIIFQEQVMFIYAEITGTGLVGANDARKTLSPKSPKQTLEPQWIEKKNKLEKQFFENGLNNGYTQEFLTHLWAELLTHTRYSFNRAHSASYAMHGMIDLWYLFYHPTEYVMACLLIDQLDNNEDAQSILYQAIKNGVEIIPPHINNSSSVYELKDGKIYLPLTVIKGWGEKSVEKFIELRNAQDNKQFNTFEQLHDQVGGRILNKTIRKKLYQLNAFDTITGDPLSFLDEIPLLTGKDAEFDSMGFVIPTQYHIGKIEKWRDSEKAIVGFIKSKKEKETKTGKPMISYKLHPSGGFWMFNDGKIKLEEGKFVGIQYELNKQGKNFGLAKHFQILSLQG